MSLDDRRGSSGGQWGSYLCRIEGVRAPSFLGGLDQPCLCPAAPAPGLCCPDYTVVGTGPAVNSKPRSVVPVVCNAGHGGGRPQPEASVQHCLLVQYTFPGCTAVGCDGQLRVAGALWGARG